MSLTNHGENAVLELFASAGTYSLALCTGDPGEAGSLANEVSGGGYARQAVSFGSASSGVISNDAGVSFPAATGSWGTVSHWALVDGGGSAFWYGAVTVPKAVTTGDIYMVPAGGLTLAMD